MKSSSSPLLNLSKESIFCVSVLPSEFAIGLIDASRKDAAWASYYAGAPEEEKKQKIAEDSRNDGASFKVVNIEFQSGEYSFKQPSKLSL